jgi:hypothetical protein
MNSEKILFIIIAIGFSILSMYIKSKKQKQASSKNSEEPYYDFPQQDESYYNPSPFETFEPSYPENPRQNINIHTKNKKTKQKMPNIETFNPTVKSNENVLQNIDLENETVLLKDFEGTELQKAFLFSEIFKNTNN